MLADRTLPNVTVSVWHSFSTEGRGFELMGGDWKKNCREQKDITLCIKQHEHNDYSLNREGSKARRSVRLQEQKDKVKNKDG